MARVLFLLTLLSFCSGVSSQATVTQPASQSIPPGQTTKLSCTRSSDGSWGSNFVWIQQRAGQTPRFLHCNGCSRGEGIPDRFTASASGTTGYLTITNMQAEDEADYYCYIWYSTGSMYIFGGGTSLAISGLPATPPTVRAFPPSAEEIKDKNTATLTCLINDFYPAPIDVTWLADGTDITQKAETARPTKQGEKYVSSSYLTMSAAEYNSHNRYTCKVTHEGKTYEQSIQRS